MDAKKVTAKQLEGLLGKVVKENENAVGYYAYKDFRIKIVKPMTGSQRYSKLYHHRRENGLCIACGKKVKKSNPATGKLYRLCEDHRKKIDGARSQNGKKKTKA